MNIDSFDKNLKVAVIIKGLMANSVRWSGHVLRREGGHVLRREGGHVLRALEFEVEGQGKKGKPKRKWKKQVEEESVEIGLTREYAHHKSGVLV